MRDVRDRNAAGRIGRAAVALMLAGLAFLAGCTTLVDNSGYAPTDLQLQEVQVGQDTRETVAQKVGAPPLDDMRRDGVWYYVSSRQETWAWRAPQEVRREVVAIRFTEGGSVSNIERFGLEAGQVVTLSRRVTNPAVPDIGFLRGLFSNTTLAPAGAAPAPGS